MILFDDKIFVKGATIPEVLAYVTNCNIDFTRTRMSGNVCFYTEEGYKTATPYCTTMYNDVPYDSKALASPASQFYKFLMSHSDFEGGKIV